MNSEKKKLRVMIVAGEDSGDRHAAALVKEINKIRGDVEFFGAAGAKMREAGVEAVVDSDDFGIVGVPEVLRAVPMFLRVMRELTDVAKKRQPDVVVLVDFPEFNLKFARKLKRAGLKVVYYISPQLWAWRQYRIRGIRNYVDLLLTILPFENEWYSERGVDHVRFVGHPLVGEVNTTIGREEFRQKNDLSATSKLVALLPGSRRKEIERNLPVMLDTVKELVGDGFVFGIAKAESRSMSEYDQLIERHLDDKSRANVSVFEGSTYDLVNASEAAVVASGTATLETALIGTPQTIVYRSSKLNYFLLRPLIGIDTFGLANLAAGKRVFREFIQDEFNVESLSAEIKRLVDPTVNRELRAAADEIRASMGEKNASTRAAEAVLQFLEDKT